MENNFQDTETEENFWDDVAAIHAMLDAEDGDQKKETERAPFSEQRFERTPAPRPCGPDRPIVMQREKKKKVRSPRRSSRGTVIALYMILFLELAGIGGILFSWYTWMQ